MLNWTWNGEEDRWQFVFERQIQLSSKKNFWGVMQPRWCTDKVEVSVVGEPDRRDASLCALVSSYAAKIDEVNEAIALYLKGRIIKVYGGYEDPDQYAEIVHPENLEVRPVEITIPDATQPERVHVFVDTFYPDPYFLYEIIFEDGMIIDARGGFQ